MSHSIGVVSCTPVIVVQSAVPGSLLRAKRAQMHCCISTMAIFPSHATPRHRLLLNLVLQFRMRHIAAKATMERLSTEVLAPSALCSLSRTCTWRMQDVTVWTLRLTSYFLQLQRYFRLIHSPSPLHLRSRVHTASSDAPPLSYWLPNMPNPALKSGYQVAQSLERGQDVALPALEWPDA
jgi:hypothetical protein